MQKPIAFSTGRRCADVDCRLIPAIKVEIPPGISPKIKIMNGECAVSMANDSLAASLWTSMAVSFNFTHPFRQSQLLMHWSYQCIDNFTCVYVARLFSSLLPFHIYDTSMFRLTWNACLKILLPSPKKNWLLSCCCCLFSLGSLYSWSRTWFDACDERSKYDVIIKSENSYSHKCVTSHDKSWEKKWYLLPPISERIFRVFH